MFNRIALIFAVLFLIGCGETVPTATETAVSPTTAAPTETVPPALPTVAATATPIPPAATITPTPEATEEALSLEAFVDVLQTAVSAQDYVTMQTLMDSTMSVGAWRSEGRTLLASSMIDEFETGALPAPTAVQFSELTSEQIGDLLGQPVESILAPDTVVAAVLHSTGWGAEGADEAILYVTEEDGRFVWSAFLYNFGPFQSAETTLVFPPIGTIYRTADGISQIQADGEPQQLLDAETAGQNGLAMSPNGRYAAYFNEQNQLMLLDTTSGEAQQLGAEFTFSTGILIWGDSETLLTGIWLDPSEGDGPNFGHVSAIDVTTGDVTIIEQERLSGSRPALSPDGASVAYAVFAAGPDDTVTSRIYTAAGVQPFDPAAFTAQNEMIAAPLFNPAWSADSSKIAWLASTGERVGLQVYDLVENTAVQLFDWSPAQFGGLIPSPVWSPDGANIALHVLANSPEGSGIWRIATDGSNSQLISAQGSNPVWADSVLLAYQSDLGIMMHEVNSEPLLQMDLPADAQLLTIGTPASEATLPDPNSVAMADEIVSQSPSDNWRAEAVWSQPVADDGLFFNFYAQLTVTDGTTTWQPIAEWRNTEQGYRTPAPFAWSENGRFLYYANKGNPDGCIVLNNGGELWRLDLQNGDTEQLSDNLGWAMALSQTETALAVNGRSFTIRTFATDTEETVELPEPSFDWQLGSMIWSPTDEHILLTQVVNPCGGGEATTAVLRVDVETLTAETILEAGEHNFTLIEWVREDEVQLEDANGQMWFIDVFSGEIGTDG